MCDQVEKAKRSEQSVAVCVVEVPGASASKCSSCQYLLVQRPKEGLLAGECFLACPLPLFYIAQILACCLLDPCATLGMSKFYICRE